jgi:hypothetical protein
VWDAKAVRHITGGVVVAGHGCRGRPGEVVVRHLSQSTVVGLWHPVGFIGERDPAQHMMTMPKYTRIEYERRFLVDSTLVLLCYKT